MNIFNLFKQSGMSDVDTAPGHSVPDSSSQPQAGGIPTQPEAEGSDANASEVSKRVHNLIILDESGSMQSIYQPALTGVNETLQTIREAQKEHKDQTHFVSLIAFDSGHYNRIYNHLAADMAIDITQEQYRPGGCTPLYDAMGRAINELRPNVAKGDVVLVTVITDGYENASREYNGTAIKSLVETLKKEGWVFTYIGANQDVEAVAASMSIDNHLAFDADEASTCAMFEHEKRSRRKFFSKISRSMSMRDLNTGYFDDDEEDAADKGKS